MAFSEDYFDYKALLVGDINGNIIKEDNSSTVRPLASVTKIMTVILTMDKIKSGQISYDTKVTVSAKAAKYKIFFCQIRRSGQKIKYFLLKINRWLFLNKPEVIAFFSPYYPIL